MKNSIDFNELISDLYQYFHMENRGIILNKFCNELLLRGWNVSRIADKYGVTPHLMNDRMIKLYTESDAFIYECSVASLEPEKIKKD